MRDLASLGTAARLHAQSEFDAGGLERELLKRPDIVAGWLRWGEDKRWSPAWYFSATQDNRYVVGYYSADESQQKEDVFDDPHHACAVYIIHELEDYRALLESKGEW